MRNDQFGYEIPMSCPATADAWDQMVLAFLSHAATAPDHLGTVLARTPDFTMAHAVKGLFCLMLGRSEMIDAARDAIPFLVITVVWLVLSLVVYGLFLVTKPNVDYAGWVHASVFLPTMIALVGHVLRQALSVLSE